MKFFLLILLLPSLAFAQTDGSQMVNKIDRLQRDVSMMQRQLAMGTDNEGNYSAVAARMGNKLDEIQDEMRDLRGMIEENQFEIRRLNEQFERMQSDVDYRFNELTDTSLSATTPPTPLVSPIIDTESAKTEPETNTSVEQSTAGTGILQVRQAPAKHATLDTFDTPRDLYNHAFRLLNETKYDKASDAFAYFTQKYPKDPLVGNAYYWRGETFYIQRDYVSAADNFRQGFEVLPQGPKAPDNLLKLAMSLHAIDRTEESCIVLKQITSKFNKISTSVTSKAQDELRRMECK